MTNKRSSFPAGRTSLKLLFALVVLIVSASHPVSAQNGASMSQAYVVPVNSCGSGQFSDYQQTSQFPNSYGNSSPDVWYTFTVPAGPAVTVSIALCGSDFDTYLHVLDAQGTQIYSNDDGGGCEGFAQSAIQQAFSSGTYYIVAEGYGSYSGNLAVSVTTTGSGSAPAGANMGNAINAGTFSGSGNYTDTRSNADVCMGNDIGQPSNDIYYKFTLTAAAQVTLSHCGSGFDTYMHLLNSSGGIIISNDDGMPGIASPCPGTQAWYQTTLSAGTYYVVSEGYGSATGNIVTTISVAGSGPPPAISYPSPSSFALGATVNLTPSNSGGPVSAPGSSVGPFSGNGVVGSANGPGASASFNNPSGLALNSSGIIYVADRTNNRIRKIAADGSVSAFVGSGAIGAADGTGAAASFSDPRGITVDASGNVYVADWGNHKVRKITPAGVVTTLAGSGVAGFSDGTGAAAKFYAPDGITVDGSGNVYLADGNNHRVRKITPAGVVTTIAGSGAIGSADGQGTAATFNHPDCLIMDATGNLYVGETANKKIRKISPSGLVTTFAGSGVDGSTDGQGISASFRSIISMSMDGAGNIYITDMSAHNIRKITPSGLVSTYAGSGSSGAVNGPALSATFINPMGLTSDASANVYVSDVGNDIIRKITNGAAYTISPALPAGLSLNLSTGVISGIPTAVSAATTYTVTAYGTGGVSSTTLSIEVTGNCVAPSQDQNYILTYTPREELSSDAALIAATCDKNRVQTEIQYFDGLGRPLQAVQVKGSGDGLKDIVQPIAYDEFGREKRKYLPYASSNNNGSYKSNALSEVVAYYQGQPLGLSVPFSTPFAETGYEASTLNRVTSQGAPGDDWQLTGTHIQHTDYDVNVLNDVYMYEAIPGTVAGEEYKSTLSALGYYLAGELYLTVTKDENWVSNNGKIGTVEEYKDKEGRVVLKRRYNTGGQKLSTYYVYDYRGNLSFVLPGGANPDGGSISQSTLDDFCYQYRYDGRKRLIEKRTPGKGWEYMVYNTADQLVMSQDQVQRNNHKWTFIKYDQLGRPVVTGICNSAGERSTQQVILDQQTVFGESKDNSSDSGYGDLTYPHQDILDHYLTINYYDDYTFPGNPYGPWDTALTNPTGLLTGTKTTVLNPDGTYGPMLWTVHYYDQEGRVVQTTKQHYLGGVSNYSTGNYDVVQNSYNFDNQIATSSRYRFTSANASVPALKVGNAYYYDHMGRRIETYEAINDHTPSILLSQVDYNEIGQIRVKHLHHEDGGRVGFLQDIDYTYNERGWLTGESSSKFDLKLAYNTGITTGATPQYNGNIAEMYSTSDHTTANSKMKYTYDALNQLAAADHSSGQLTENGISYDAMGNIGNLNRGGISAAHLTYSYIGNQLQTVLNNNSTFRSYTYDDNGNATSDGTLGTANKKINYNILNLPESVTQNGSTLGTYVYNAAGEKLQSTGSDGTRDYINGVVYHNGAIDFVQTEEGKAVRNVSDGSYHYVYDLKDHLGNVRVSFDKSSSTGEVEVVQEDEYYAFGLRSLKYDNSNGNRYLYNGKEIQTDLVNQYDYGARFYDPVIARWNVVDSKAELGRRFSPYNYAENNPIRNIDPDGNFCIPCIVEAAVAIYEAVTVEEVVNIGLGATTTAIITNGINSYSGDRNYSVQDNTSVSKPKLQAIVKTGSEPTGSYTNEHESGKEYHGKGGEKRAAESGAEKAKKYNDPLKKTDWTPAKNDREAFKDEDTRMKTNEGGHKSEDNYNKRASPGANYKQEDDNKPKPEPKPEPKPTRDET